MVNPLNSAVQSAIVNPYQQRPDAQQGNNQIDRDTRQARDDTRQTGTSLQTEGAAGAQSAEGTTESRSLTQTAAAQNNTGQQQGQSETVARGSLLDVSV